MVVCNKFKYGLFVFLVLVVFMGCGFDGDDGV